MTCPRACVLLENGWTAQATGERQEMVDASVVGGLKAVWSEWWAARSDSGVGEIRWGWIKSGKLICGNNEAAGRTRLHPTFLQLVWGKNSPLHTRAWSLEEMTWTSVAPKGPLRPLVRSYTGITMGTSTLNVVPQIQWVGPVSLTDSFSLVYTPHYLWLC